MRLQKYLKRNENVLNRFFVAWTQSLQIHLLLLLHIYWEAASSVSLFWLLLAPVSDALLREHQRAIYFFIGFICLLLFSRPPHETPWHPLGVSMVGWNTNQKPRLKTLNSSLFRCSFFFFNKQMNLPIKSSFFILTTIDMFASLKKKRKKKQNTNCTLYLWPYPEWAATKTSPPPASFCSTKHERASVVC